MINTKLLDELADRLKAIATTNPAADVEKNMRALLSSTFARLNLVTRDEFDAQSAMLARTRAKLEELKKQVAELEQKSGRT